MSQAGRSLGRPVEVVADEQDEVAVDVERWSELAARSLLAEGGAG